jgi:hypothetical protein
MASSRSTSRNLTPDRSGPALGAAPSAAMTRAAAATQRRLLTLVEPIRQWGRVLSLQWVNRSPDAGSSTGVSGWVRLAGSDADRVFGTGAVCGGGSGSVWQVLLVVRRTSGCVPPSG